MHKPTVYTRHNLQLHALLLENQPWFCARDLGRLNGLYLDERKVSKLDTDQRQTLEIRYHGQLENMLMISKSDVYALLVYYYAQGHRLLREWLTHQVVPTLRNKQQSRSSDRPMLSLLDWPEMSLSFLHWQDEDWIRLRDMPYLLLKRTRRRVPPSKTWLQEVAEYFQSAGHSTR